MQAMPYARVQISIIALHKTKILVDTADFHRITYCSDGL